MCVMCHVCVLLCVCVVCGYVCNVFVFVMYGVGGVCELC